MTLTEVQTKILQFLCDHQVYDGRWDDMSQPPMYYVNDECPLYTYNTFVKETGLSKTRLRPEVLELRDAGYICLNMAVNYDGIPCGSGWMLTNQGLEYSLSIGITPTP